MNKPLFVFSGPVDTFSGYGAKSRDIILSIIESDKYEVAIFSQRWGQCPFGFLDSNNSKHKKILDCINPTQQLTKQPDVWAQCTVPNEMQRVGKYNILFTSGIETTICDPSWIEGCNRADLIIVPSQHTKTVFEQSKFEKRDNNTKQVVGTIQLEKPISVLFEGVDTNIYNNVPNCIETDLNDVLDSIDEEYNFLFIGHWLLGSLGEDRKNIGMLIKTFLETFKGKDKKPGLILKTSSATYSIMDREEILDKIQKIRKLVEDEENLPNIYLLHGELSDEEMNELYNHPKIKTHISFTKGEGFGRPLLEATISQKPMIAPNWSGQIDFLDKELCILLPGQVTQIHPSAVVPNMLIADSGWFTVDYNVASKAMVDVYKNYKTYIDKAKKQSYRSRTEFSIEKMSELLNKILDERVPKQIPLQLPKLKPISLKPMTLQPIENAK